MTLIHRFPGAGAVSIEQIGGKGHSLVRMAAAGLPVPPGAILTTAFFAPWFEAVEASEPWRELIAAPHAEWNSRCAAVQAWCSTLPLDAGQGAALDALRADLDGLVAVRSSSPDEDLATASFAGAYVTCLGVRPDELESAVRACFASSLDERVLVYKRERDLDVFSPRLAVIVQEQLDSRVAGVAFSLDPVTNDHDHAVIDASWGLGESVVAGLVTPDHWVIDKVDRTVIEATLGAKQQTITLGVDGGTVEEASTRADEPTLDADRLDALVDLVCRVEALDDRPVDIEWALAGDGPDARLFLLQARPITTHVPVPPELRTAPGEPRRLYTDIALSSGFTINAPISPMGLDWMRESVGALAEIFLGRLDLELGPGEHFWMFTGSRMYQDTSNMLWLMSPQKMADAAVDTDPLMAETLAALDAERYKPDRRPPWLSLRMLRVVPRFAVRLAGFMMRIVAMLAFPERAKRRYVRRTAAFEREIGERFDPDLPLATLRQRLTGSTMRYLFDVTMPALGAGMAAVKIVPALVGAKRSDERRELADALAAGHEGNVVVAMGIALHRLAACFDPTDFEDLDGLVDRVERRELPPDVLDAWDAFVARFGHRGPLEMDLARPRYADDPRLALQQMASMRTDDATFDPEAGHRRLVEQRRQATEALYGRLGWIRRALLRRVDRVLGAFAGTRDTPKHHNLMLHQVVRRRTLIEGEALVRDGRLDRVEEIFHLTFDDLDRAANDPSLDLRHVAEERMRWYRQLDAQGTRFPAMIDSRGRILRPPPRDEAPGELRGTGLSAGSVRGPVKVLHRPDEKPVEPGDILVAYATDPGWTPLFANASAVVLEVGGVLQHGALVARELGKPCVAGIDRLLDRLTDGEVVEVDGTDGVVRRLAAADAADQPTNL
ncbi:MAG: PEP/pyruvate-binding domain-containing protein [Acidobacteriota bacterium]